VKFALKYFVSYGPAGLETSTVVRFSADVNAGLDMVKLKLTHTTAMGRPLPSNIEVRSHICRCRKNPISKPFAVCL
jgi:hypothetical protein